MTELAMPFGEYKGTLVHELPSGYLKWLAENCDWNTQIQEAADEEWQHRDKYNCHKEE